MSHPYDTLTAQRLRNKTCVKWHHFDDDVLPLWVADMDFPVAEPIKAAITEVLDRNDLGYPPHDGLPGLKEAALERLSARYGWQLQPEQLQALNGTVSELYLAVLACTSVGEEVIVQAPIYPPFLSAIGDAGRNVLYNQLLETPHGWEIDFDGLEKLVTPATRLLALCNPHNPSGRVFKRDELEKLADFALRHRLWVVSDELHSDLVYPGHAHLPLASCPEIGQRTLTLFGPTKTFTIAGLRISFIASRNSELLERIKTFAHGLVGAPNVLAQAAAIAAYREGGPWLEQTLSYLDGNRRFLADYLKEHLPGVGYRPPEGTYLAWLDFHKLLPADELEDFLLKEAKVGLNLGPVYGPGGEGFARLNFATSRGILTEALDRIRDAYHARLD
jgi:cystathionine beta-lyase